MSTNYLNVLLNSQKSQQAIDIAQIEKYKASMRELMGVCDERAKVIKLMEAAMNSTNAELTIKDVLS